MGVAERLVKNQDPQEAGTMLRKELKRVETALRREIKRVEISLRREIEKLDTTIRTGMRDLERRMTIRFGGLIALTIGVLVTLQQLLR